MQDRPPATGNDESLRATCDYCGLPLGAAWGRAAAADQATPEPQFCCLGCRVAAAITSEAAEEGHASWALARLGLAVFFSMNVMVFAMALWTFSYSETEAAGDSAARVWCELLRYGSLLFAAPVLLLLGGPLLEEVSGTLRRRQLNVDCLLALGVAASFAYSMLALWRGGAHTYFEVGCMILVAVTLGRWLEATGKQRTKQALRGLQRLLPERARLVHALAESDGGTQQQLTAAALPQQQQQQQQQEIPREQVRVGDVVRVLPGERLPVDGLVARGQALLDQQLITGESEPTRREPGDPVFAGSLCVDGDLWIRTTAAANDDTLHRLMQAVEEATVRPSQSERLADRWARWFVPAVMLIAAAAFAVHLPYSGFHAALMSALAVLLVACPCALGVATPMAIWSALGCASRHQVLFRDGDALCRLTTVKTMCFDKTGTLTTGELELQQLVLAEQQQEHEVWRLAAHLARGGTHALSRAIARHPQAQSAGPLIVEDPQTLPGRGLQATAPSVSDRVFLGSLRWMQEESFHIDSHLQAELDAPSHRADLLCCLAWDGCVRAVYFFKEQARPEAEQALQQLERQGVRPLILSGDRSAVAEALGSSLGVETRGELLPADKLQVVEQLRSSGVCCAMVGDGINDAPALAAANVGVAMGCGADVSREAADVCLLGNDLLRLPWALALAGRTAITIRQNLLWTLGYNSVGIVLAAAGLMNPILAAIAMVGSSLLVVTNSLRLAGFEADGLAAAAADKPLSLSSARLTTDSGRARLLPSR